MPKETLASEIVKGCKLDILAICYTIKKGVSNACGFQGGSRVETCTLFGQLWCAKLCVCTPKIVNYSMCTKNPLTPRFLFLVK